MALAGRPAIKQHTRALAAGQIAINRRAAMLVKNPHPANPQSEPAQGSPAWAK